MIDQFNMPNIKMLIDIGFKIHVACNFKDGNTCSEAQINELINTLRDLQVNYYQVDFKRSVMKVMR